MPATFSRRFSLTTRDVEMLESIATARYITAEALEWLHFPTWRTRWKAAKAAGKAESYRPAPHLYRRLNHLLDYGLVYRLRRPVERSLETFGREPDLYLLTDEGAETIGTYGSIPFDDLHVTRKRTRSYHNLGHAAMIGQVYAAIRGRILLRNDSLEVHGWQGDHITRRSYDKVHVPIHGSGKRCEYGYVGVQPDATFEFCQGERRWRVFVEVDQGTRATATWATKMEVYSRYAGTREYIHRYGDAMMLLFAVTTTPAQRIKLMRATGGVYGQAIFKRLVLFAERTAVQPEEIGKNWHKITSITPNHRTPDRPEITTDLHTFF